MGDPGQYHVNQVKLLVISLFDCCPADVLPQQVHGSCTVEQNCTDSTDHGSEGSSQSGAVSGGSFKAIALEGNHRQRNTDVGYGTDIRGYCSAGRDQCDVDNLHCCTDHDAGRNVAENDTADKAADQRSSQCIVTDGSTAETGHT